MKRIALIDTGSNTIRLVVYDVAQEGRTTQIVNTKKTAGLSNYVEGKGDSATFTREGVRAASRVLIQLLTCAKNLNCDEIYVFATAVLRNISNSSEALMSIEERIEQKIDLLSGKEEATYGFLGAFSGKSVGENTLLVDLGGGSCEITRCERDIEVNGIRSLKGNLQTTSLKIGCVSAYSRYVERIFPKRGACEDIRAAFCSEFEQMNNRLHIVQSATLQSQRESEWQGKQQNNQEKATNNVITHKVYGIGGSIRAIAKIMREINKLDKMPKEISFADISTILELLHENPDAFAHTVVRAVPDRIHSVVPGCLIILQLMQCAQIDGIKISKRGLREGYLLSKIEK